jgi:predicted ATPase
MKLVIENVRSFARRHSISIRPLTLLVGENSTGKSTFLAALSAVSDSNAFPGPAGLNKPPYDLGGFENIATYKSGSGRAKKFGLGFAANSDRHIQTIAHYAPFRGETRLKEFALETPRGNISLEWRDNRVIGTVTNLADFPDIHINRESTAPDFVQTGQLPLLIIEAFTSEHRSNPAMIDTAIRMTGELSSAVIPVASIAPIRSTPKRTYDFISEEFDPRGDHIPLALSRLLEDAAYSDSDTTRVKRLMEFGRESGLFRGLKAKKLGRKQGSPFQIEVKISGPSFNLTDVGYGVSQSLPIIVQSIMATTAPRILLQQPEVHLHPRAQAAMATFFATLVRNKAKQFVVETHSDHLIDRVRLEVARGNIDCEDVLILFFRRPRVETRVYEITLDNKGNIQNAPANYREFFLKEELDLFNRANLCA